MRRGARLLCLLYPSKTTRPETFQIYFLIDRSARTYFTRATFGKLSRAFSPRVFLFPVSRSSCDVFCVGFGSRVGSIGLPGGCMHWRGRCGKFLSGANSESTLVCSRCDVEERAKMAMEICFVVGMWNVKLYVKKLCFYWGIVCARIVSH